MCDRGVFLDRGRRLAGRDAQLLHRRLLAAVARALPLLGEAHEGGLQRARPSLGVLRLDALEQRFRGRRIPSLQRAAQGDLLGGRVPRREPLEDRHDLDPTMAPASEQLAQQPQALLGLLSLVIPAHTAIGFERRLTARQEAGRDLRDAPRGQALDEVAERRAAREVVSPSQRIQRPLDFFHVPRAGGEPEDRALRGGPLPIPALQLRAVLAMHERQPLGDPRLAPPPPDPRGQPVLALQRAIPLRVVAIDGEIGGVAGRLPPRVLDERALDRNIGPQPVSEAMNQAANRAVLDPAHRVTDAGEGVLADRTSIDGATIGGATIGRATIGRATISRAPIGRARSGRTRGRGTRRGGTVALGDSTGDRMSLGEATIDRLTFSEATIDRARLSGRARRGRVRRRELQPRRHHLRRHVRVRRRQRRRRRLRRCRWGDGRDRRHVDGLRRRHRGSDGGRAGLAVDEPQERRRRFSRRVHERNDGGGRVEEHRGVRRSRHAQSLLRALQFTRLTMALYG